MVTEAEMRRIGQQGDGTSTHSLPGLPVMPFQSPETHESRTSWILRR